MYATELDIEIYRGIPFRREWEFDDADGAPYNFDSCVAKVMIAAKMGESPIFNASTLNGMVTCPRPGVIACYIPAEYTAKLPGGVLEWALNILLPNKVDELTLLRGKCRTRI